MASSKSQPVIDVEPMEIGVTICSVCGGSEEEDLVLLCDGEGCTNEIHMYCLKPIVTAVPEGDWYCPVCDADGSTLHLENMLRSHDLHFERECLTNKEAYQQYLTLLQQRHHPAKDWRPNTLDNRVSSEFDASSCFLVGMPLKIYSEVDDQEHTGRIISSRQDPVLNRWSHLVQFRRYF
jgi:PHD-finger